MEKIKMTPKVNSHLQMQERVLWTGSSAPLTTVTVAVIIIDKFYKDL